MLRKVRRSWTPPRLMMGEVNTTATAEKRRVHQNIKNKHAVAVWSGNLTSGVYLPRFHCWDQILVRKKYKHNPQGKGALTGLTVQRTQSVVAERAEEQRASSAIVRTARQSHCMSAAEACGGGCPSLLRAGSWGNRSVGKTWGRELWELVCNWSSLILFY